MSELRLDPTDAIDRPIIARQVRAARQSGREGRDRAKTTRGRADLEQAFDEGADEGTDEGDGQAPAAAAAPAAKGPGFRKMGPGWGSFSPRSPARPPTRMQDAGGLLSGLLLYTVVITYIRYGPAGWKGWLSAKFLNQPMSTAAAAGASGGTTQKGPIQV